MFRLLCFSSSATSACTSIGCASCQASSEGTVCPAAHSLKACPIIIIIICHHNEFAAAAMSCAVGLRYSRCGPPGHCQQAKHDSAGASNPVMLLLASTGPCCTSVLFALI